VNDYTSVATLYDHYVTVDLDIPFFVDAIVGARGVLELMAGTGRVSTALVETGARVTCVDGSEAMLRVLRRKLGARLTGTLCADVSALPLRRGFDIALIPFNSFAEVLDQGAQRQVLAEVHRVLRPGGRFVCTLHNPLVRRRSLDGASRTLAQFQVDDGTWTVEAAGYIEPDGQVARSRQTYVCRGVDGGVRTWFEQDVRFALIERGEFEQLAAAAAFEVESLVGDYTGAAFDAATSPYLIWTLRSLGRAV
jgi:SAM-dependent methyltransferase